MENETPVEAFLTEKKHETPGKANGKLKWTIRIVLLLLTCTTLGYTSNIHEWELCMKETHRQPEPLRVNWSSVRGQEHNVTFKIG